ncbi:hypothetical protein BC834DRAFT_833130 [Gloeopeniophorella convolvens]|nr:hypothetical protein BC834DRAFT_833130 [Gloeopeniophorella convolvens]
MNLLQQGCLSSSPSHISWAISLQTLELYQWLRVRQPRVSIQAWVRSICDYHNVRSRSYWQHFSDTFNVYLKIRRGVELRVRESLGRLDHHWRVKSSCPCCQNQLPGEAPLQVSVMGVLDGNQSLKRVRLREGAVGDPREFTSDYYIPEDHVDVFKHDSQAKGTNDPASQEPQAWSKDLEEATPADGANEQTTCTERWKAAQSDNLKRMWAIYHETGIFLSACRHGLIWWICDMVLSGELYVQFVARRMILQLIETLRAKYPLAIVNEALDAFGDKVGLGYDIGCSFTEMIAKSSISEKAKAKGLRLVVPAFHGYAHKRLCQLSFHPLYAGGFGIEDLETAEWIFSSFNGLANVTRYASHFHRHQSINLYAQQHDDDKYQELCMYSP